MTVTGAPHQTEGIVVLGVLKMLTAVHQSGEAGSSESA
jgi:hypothetical protein